VRRFAMSCLLLSAGCASPYGEPAPDILFSPLDEKVRRSLGRIRIVRGADVERVDLALPAKGCAAGAGRGALCTIGAFGEVGILFFPVFALGGAVYGAAAASATEQVDEASAGVLRAFQDSRFASRFTEALNKKSAALKGYAFVPSEAPADSELQLRVTELGTRGPWTVNTPSRPVIAVAVKLSRVMGGEVLWESRFRYAGVSRSLAEWSAGDVAALRSELARASELLAEDILDELFRVWLPSERKP
jgi:hypothetical protein